MSKPFNNSSQKMDRPFFVNAKFLADSAHRKYPDLPQVPGETLFVHPDDLPAFTETLLPQIHIPFILITTLSDIAIPYDQKKASFKLQKNPYLIRWYAMNCIEETSKLKHLPVGMDYANNPLWQPIEQKIASLKDTPKKHKILGNFHFMMDTKHAWDRQEAIEQIPKDLIDYQESRISRKEMLALMASYKFIASPFGNGYDCHRTWEALALGCIPIVRSSGLDPMFKGLPVLIVKNWSDITEELLATFKPDESAKEKLSLAYWISEIRKAPYLLSKPQ